MQILYFDDFHEPLQICFSSSYYKENKPVSISFLSQSKDVLGELRCERSPYADTMIEKY